VDDLRLGIQAAGVAGIAEATDTVLSAGLGVTRLSAARVTFTLNTSTGNQIVSYGLDQNGRAFRGKLFLFASSPSGTGSVAASGDAQGINECFGVAGTDSGQWVTYFSVADGVSVTDAGDGGDDTKCIEFITPAGVTTEAASFGSAGDGNFTLEVTTAGAARTMECLVLGGTDLQVEVGYYPNSPAGDRVITGDSFERKALLLAGGTNSEGSGRITYFVGHRSIGAARSPNEQWAIGTRSRGDLSAGAQTASFNTSAAVSAQ
jgi:hypothetical protein